MSSGSTCSQNSFIYISAVFMCSSLMLLHLLWILASEVRDIFISHILWNKSLKLMHNIYLYFSAQRTKSDFQNPQKWNFRNIDSVLMATQRVILICYDYKEISTPQINILWWETKQFLYSFFFLIIFKYYSGNLSFYGFVKDNIKADGTHCIIIYY